MQSSTGNAVSGLSSKLWESSMNIIRTVSEMQRTAETLRLAGKRIGFVPTMGALHAGHLSLVQLAKVQTDETVMSIFVNPSQFSVTEDLSKYPRPIERDLALAESAGVSVVFLPDASEIYPSSFSSFVEVETISHVLEGEIRPTHFRGVATVVAKLFNITKPHVAVFGQKDAQQTVVVRRLVEDLNFDIQLVIAPIVREPDGLAMSSRNIYLSTAERGAALCLSQSLNMAEAMIASGETSAKTIVDGMTALVSKQPLARIDYIKCVSAASFQEQSHVAKGTFIVLAAKFGQTRLLDNLLA
jgi:pantoate--beta-alanine ligase